MRYSLILACVALLSFLLPNSGEAAGAYKWVDEEGNVHFSQTRPKHGPEAEQIKMRSPGKGTPLKSSTNEEDAKPGEEQKEPSATDREQKEKNREAREKNCAAAKRNLEQLELRARRYLYKGKDGKMHRLEDGKRDEQIKLTRKQIEENCN